MVQEGIITIKEVGRVRLASAGPLLAPSSSRLPADPRLPTPSWPLPLLCTEAHPSTQAAEVPAEAVEASALASATTPAAAFAAAEVVISFGPFPRIALKMILSPLEGIRRPP